VEALLRLIARNAGLLTWKTLGRREALYNGSSEMCVSEMSPPREVKCVHSKVLEKHLKHGEVSKEA